MQVPSTSIALGIDALGKVVTAGPSHWPARRTLSQRPESSELRDLEDELVNAPSMNGIPDLIYLDEQFTKTVYTMLVIVDHVLTIRADTIAKQEEILRLEKRRAQVRMGKECCVLKSETLKLERQRGDIIFGACAKSVPPRSTTRTNKRRASTRDFSLGTLAFLAVGIFPITMVNYTAVQQVVSRRLTDIDSTLWELVRAVIL